MLSQRDINRRQDELRELNIDAYIEAVVAPAEDQGRIAAPVIIRQLGRVIEEQSAGPYYQASVLMNFGAGVEREIGFIAQDRTVELGSWMPEHHLRAADFIDRCSSRAMPIVSFMDTPGADPREEANANNQAHSISRLIAEMSNVDVPNVGLVYGIGYSGGAIPLAASNVILSLRDGVFSTIQPAGLANIARRLNLSWQECAKYVGVSPYELYAQGNIDAIVDFSPADGLEQLENLRLALIHSIMNVESRTKEFVAENPYIMDHYRQSLMRYLKPSEQLQAMQSSASLALTRNPTEYLNVFGVAFRYLRYLQVRKRIKATSTQQYGRLAEQEVPSGELHTRADRERRQTFLYWLQDPDRVVYDESLSKAWRNYQDKRQAMNDERGRIAQMIFGEPKQNYENARANLLTSVGVFLYNRWKKEARGNLEALQQYLQDDVSTRQILQVSDIADATGLLNAIISDAELRDLLYEQFSHEGRKLLDAGLVEGTVSGFVAKQLVAELNMLIASGALAESAGDASMAANRRFLSERLPAHIPPQVVV